MRIIFIFLMSLPIVSYAYLPIDEVKIYKSAHRMDLYFQGKITKSYQVMLGRGGSGPKQQEGDKKVPEGQYFLDEKNENSKFYRSIHISYPNEKDIERAKEAGVEPGGSVFIHGLPNTNSHVIEWLREKVVKIKDKNVLSKLLKMLDWTQGCVAVSDKEMEEIFENMPTPTPVTIFH
jgi:murein L,D-transpeptidase YafK